MSAKADEDVSLSLPERIKAFRKARGWLQIDLARVCNVTQGQVSRWEKETNGDKPSAAALAIIAQLADEKDRAHWLAEAGMSALIPEEDPELSRIPVLRDAAAAGTPRAIDPREVDFVLPLPSRWVPAGGKLYGIKIAGDSMSPLLDDGYIALVDISCRDVNRLIDRMVLARDGDEVTVKWLRKQEEMYLLVPQNTARHQIRVWSTSDNRAIVGEVVRWIGIPPPAKKRK